MSSPSGRYTVVFNGEIYNFAEVKDELGSSQTYRGHSDTEIMLAAIDRWGIVPAFRRFVGMFALALWDAEERRLHLVRDRLGEKPLYYGWMNGTLLFGSELKALRAHPDWTAEIDRDSLAAYLRHSYVPGTRSIYRGIHKVAPGCVLTFDGQPNAEPVETPYWSAFEAARRGVESAANFDEPEALDELNGLLRQAVGQQMVADVPVGAFLSGGIDSSLIVALMQSQSTRPVKTFTIGFHEERFDEAKFAAAVARHLHTDHTELYVTPQQALDLVPRLPVTWDEPFSDPSQIPTQLVAALARQQVTVSLSGDGGDEMFGGYSRYLLGKRLETSVARVPRQLRRIAAGLGRSVGVSSWDRMISVVDPLIGERRRSSISGDRIHKALSVFAAPGAGAAYRALTTHWSNPEAVVLGAHEPAASPTWESLAALGDPIHRMMFTDLVTYLPNDILVKVDRAAMSVSLESRAPFLDHRVVEAAWRLPLSTKIRGGKGKWPLRRLLESHVPNALIDRPKMGFGVPIDSWLRGPLKSWAGDLLSPDRLRRGGFLEPGAVEQKWNEHQKGTRNWQYLLWDVLMFEAWRDSQAVS